MRRNRKERREEAISRDELRQRRSIDEQLEVIKQRRGNSVKETARLTALKIKENK